MNTGFDRALTVVVEDLSVAAIDRAFGPEVATPLFSRLHGADNPFKLTFEIGFDPASRRNVHSL